MKPIVLCRRCGLPVGRSARWRSQRRLVAAGVDPAPHGMRCGFCVGMLLHDLGLAPPRKEKPPKAPKPRQADHAQDFVVGGVQSPKLLALARMPAVIPDDFQFCRGVPASRAECPKPDELGVRLCPFIGCRHHLWRVDGHDRPGRRWAHSKPSETLIAPRNRLTCALDCIDIAQGQALSEETIAAVLGTSARQVRRVANRARRRVQAMAKAAALLEEMVRR